MLYYAYRNLYKFTLTPGDLFLLSDLCSHMFHLSHLQLPPYKLPSLSRYLNIKIQNFTKSRNYHIRTDRSLSVYLWSVADLGEGPRAQTPTLFLMKKENITEGRNAGAIKTFTVFTDRYRKVVIGRSVAIFETCYLLLGLEFLWWLFPGERCC